MSEQRDNRPLTGQARLCAELLPYLKEVEERLPQRTAEELQLTSDMEGLEGRPLAEWEKNIAVAQARMLASCRTKHEFGLW